VRERQYSLRDCQIAVERPTDHVARRSSGSHVIRHALHSSPANPVRVPQLDAPAKDIEQLFSPLRGLNPEFTREFTILRQDATEFQAEIGLRPLPTTEGVWIVASVVDLTEQKRLTKTDREQNERAAVYCEAASEGMIAVDTAGTIEMVNKAMERVAWCGPSLFRGLFSPAPEQSQTTANDRPGHLFLFSYFPDWPVLYGLRRRAAFAGPRGLARPLGRSDDVAVRIEPGAGFLCALLNAG